MNRDGVSRRRFVSAGGAALVAGLAGCSSSGGSGDGAATDGASSSGTVKIGVLEDRSGTFSLVGTPKWRASRLAIEEINADGGIMGNRVELYDPDPQSNNSRYKQLTRKMIQQRDVDLSVERGEIVDELGADDLDDEDAIASYLAV